MHQEKTIGARTVFDGRIMRIEVLDVELADGTRSVREILRHKPAVAVLARHPDGRFAFVRQYRKAVEQVMLEIVAGLRDPGEEPEAAARRELREETGFNAAQMTWLGKIYPTPGYVDEVTDLYFAELAPGNGGQKTDPDERVEAVFIARTEFERMLRAREVTDAKTVAVWTLFEKIVEGV